MNHTAVWLVRSVFVVSAMLALNPGVVHAQTGGQIAMFDPNGGAGYCNNPNNVDCVDSIITQVAGTTIGIGVPTPDPATRLHVVGLNLFSPAGFFTNSGQAVRGVSTGGLGQGDVGVWGTSEISAGVFGNTNNPNAVGLLAYSAGQDPANRGLGVIGISDLEGRVGVNGVPNPTFGIQLPNLASADGRGLANGWPIYSSRRWKTNIQTIQGGLGKVERLRGVSFDWKENGGHDIGLIAEEVGDVVPEVVQYEENGKDARSLDYARLTALLIEAVKEQQSQIRGLQAQLHELQAEHSETVRK